MLNLQICTVIIMTKNNNNNKKNHAFPEIRFRDIWVQSPPSYSLRYGGQCNLQIKIIDIC